MRVSGCIRVQPAAAMMGQAVGTAAVQAIAQGQAACDLDTVALVETLRKAGAYLPQKNACERDDAFSSVNGQFAKGIR